MKRIILIYSLFLGCLGDALPLMAQHTLQSGATVEATDVCRLRDSVIITMRLDLGGRVQPLHRPDSPVRGRRQAHRTALGGSDGP